MEAPPPAGYITPEALLNKLPANGKGVARWQAEQAINSAKEEVIGLTNDEQGTSEMLRTAVAHMAQADLEDDVYGRDSKDRDQLHVLRRNGVRLVDRFLEIRALKQGAEDQNADGVPDAKGYAREVNLWG